MVIVINDCVPNTLYNVSKEGLGSLAFNMHDTHRAHMHTSYCNKQHIHKYSSS